MPKSAKIFMNGRSQAIRLPVEFRFSGREVFIVKRGAAVIIRPKPSGWDEFFARSPRIPSDFLQDRWDLPPEKREMF